MLIEAPFLVLAVLLPFAEGEQLIGFPGCNCRFPVCMRRGAS